MPIYHMNLSGGRIEAEDVEGQVCKDDAEEGYGASRRTLIMSDEVVHGHLDLNEQIDIVAPHQRPVAIVPFSEAVDIKPKT